MNADTAPRAIMSVLVEEAEDSVLVTWGLGERVTRSHEFFGYAFDYFDPEGAGGKRFGVRFHETTTAYVFDHPSGQQANYTSESITVSDRSVAVRYRDAGLGIDRIGTMSAFSHIDGEDVQSAVPVTLLR